MVLVVLVFSMGIKNLRGATISEPYLHELHTLAELDEKI
jgi:hypothetical protein